MVKPQENLPTIREFCDYIGIEPICTLLRDIKKHYVEAVDIMIQGTDEWLTADDRQKLKTVSPDDSIERFRIRGMSGWDGSDWKFCEIVEGADGLEAVANARENFEFELEMHNAEMEFFEEI